MANTSLWTDEFMNSMRLTGDPLADVVIAELTQDGQLDRVNGLMRNLVMNEYVPLDSVPAVVAGYLVKTESLPDWAEPEKLDRAGKLFWQYGPEIILILTCYGLPFCYLGKNGVPVLVLTTRLVSNPQRRILETAQLVVDVMQAGGLTSERGSGRRTAQKVRLMHAAVRALAPRSPEWKTSYGVPVNQEDLAGTLMAFSWIMLDGLKKLGLDVPPEDQEAFLHCWRVVGELLGLRAELQPVSMDEAALLTAIISRREFGASAYGVEITQALTDMLANIIPGDLFRHAPSLFIRYFLGEEHAAWLGIQEDRWVEIASAPLRFLGMQRSDILNDCVAMRKLAQFTGKLIVDAAVLVQRAGNRPSFTIPAELQQQWGGNWRS